MWGFIEKYLPVSLYVHVGCTPMKIMFYFHSSWCSCCTPIPASLQMALWCLLPNHLLMPSLVTGQTDVLSGEKFLPSEALQLFWEDTHPHPHPPPPAPRNDSLHPRCPVVWWTLTVWKSLSRDHYVLRWQEAVGPGNVLKSRGCGENSSVCRTLSEEHSQCCLLWAGTGAGASSDEISGICFWKTGPMERCEPPLPAVSS